LGGFYLCYIFNPNGDLWLMGKPLSGTWNHKRSWVQTRTRWISSFCDIRQIKIFDQIYLFKPDIKKCNFFFFHLNIQVKYHTSKFFLFGGLDVNPPDIHCYSIVAYQHLGFHIFCKKNTIKTIFLKKKINIKEGKKKKKRKKKYLP